MQGGVNRRDETQMFISNVGTRTGSQIRKEIMKQRDELLREGQ